MSQGRRRTTSTPTLSDKIFRVLTIIAALYFAYFAIEYLIRSTPPYGGIFINTWMSGRAALAGHPADWFDVDAYNLAIRSQFGLPPTAPLCNWSYPPHIMLFTWVFALLPYVPAWILWGLVGFTIYFFVASRGERRLDRLVFLAVWPAVISNFFAAENGFFTAALMIGGLTMLEKRPIVSGVLFSLLTMKPQLGLLLPSMLIASQRWRCFCAATITVVVLVGITMAIWGVDIWGAYFRVAVPVQNLIWEKFQQGDINSMPTAYMNMRALGATVVQAWLVQVPVSLSALGAVIWTFSKKRDPVLSQALFVTASFVVTPYVFVHDMVILGWVINRLRDRLNFTLIDDLTVLSIWLLPIVANPYPHQGIIAFVVFPMFLMARLLWHLHQDNKALSPKAVLKAA